MGFAAPSWAADAAIAPAAIASQKLDSGPGGLPHYSHWGDTSGRLPVVCVSQAR